MHQKSHLTGSIVYTYKIPSLIIELYFKIHLYRSYENLECLIISLTIITAQLRLRFYTTIVRIIGKENFQIYVELTNVSKTCPKMTFWRLPESINILFVKLGETFQLFLRSSLGSDQLN